MYKIKYETDTFIEFSIDATAIKQTFNVVCL